MPPSPHFKIKQPRQRRSRQLMSMMIGVLVCLRHFIFIIRKMLLIHLKRRRIYAILSITNLYGTLFRVVEVHRTCEATATPSAYTAAGRCLPERSACFEQQGGLVSAASVQATLAFLMSCRLSVSLCLSSAQFNVPLKYLISLTSDQNHSF